MVFGVVILTVSGNARPLLAPDQLPFGGGAIGRLLFVVVFWGLVAAEVGDLVLVGTSMEAVKAVAEGVSGDA